MMEHQHLFLLPDLLQRFYQPAMMIKVRPSDDDKVHQVLNARVQLLRVSGLSCTRN